MILHDNIARSFGSGDNHKREDGIQRNYYHTVDNIKINNVSGSTLTDYQVTVTKNTSDNVRFAQVKKIDHWKESDDKRWVNVTSLTNNTNTTIYMYYGNDEASSESNLDDTMVFGDDFEDNSFNTTKWDEPDTSGTYSESGGKLTVTAPSSSNFESIASDNPFISPVILEANVYITVISNANSFASFAFYTTQGGGNSINANEFFTKDDYSANYAISGDDTNSELISIDSSNFGSWKKYKIVRKGDATDFYVNNVNIANGSYDISGGRYVQFRGRYSSEIQVEWVFIRKYASPEPTVSIVGTIALL